MGVKTVKEARALPEASNRLDFTEPFTLGGGMQGDDIMLFIDSDGRAMHVIETANGPAKAEFSL